MKSYSYWFEGDRGCVSGEIEANSFRHASNILKLKYPNDHGADGELTSEDGDDQAIDW